MAVLARELGKISGINQEFLKRQVETPSMAVEGIVEGLQVDEGPATTQTAHRPGLTRRAAAKVPT